MIRPMTTLCAKIAARELVERDHVAAQADAESAAQNGQRFEGRCADSVVVASYLVAAGQIQRTEHAPDVGAPETGRRISRTVG
jgi:hypothetical protein